MGRVFSGGNDLVTLANESNFDFEHNHSFSVSIWIKSSKATSQIFVQKMNSANRGYSVYQSGNAASFQIANSLSNRIGVFVPESVVNIHDDVYHNIVWTYNGNGQASGITVHIDGIDRTSSLTVSLNGLSSMTILNNDSVLIGNNTTVPLDGIIAEVCIWNVALSSSEAIQLNTQKPNTVRFGDIVACLPLTSSSTTTESDIVGTNDGTITGDPAQGEHPSFGISANTLDELTDVSAGTATKGKLLVGDGTVWSSIGVGTNNQVLTADSTQTKGVKWVNPSSNFATKSLDNLSSVAINMDLLPSGDGDVDLGSSTKRWGQGHFKEAVITDRLQVTDDIVGDAGTVKISSDLELVTGKFLGFNNLSTIAPGAASIKYLRIKDKSTGKEFKILCEES